MYVINIYRDGVFYIGDIEDHRQIERMANKTTEFSDNQIVQKHLLSIKRRFGFTIDGFKCVLNALNGYAETEEERMRRIIYG